MYRSEPEYDFVCVKDVMVSMRDGVRLATDIYRPANEGEIVEDKFPTILIRTPYNKEAPNVIATAEYYVQRGYVFVLQDTRARFKSEGDVWDIAEMVSGEDGYDTVEWIAKQFWSNGKVGATGTSMLAQCVAAMAAKNPPHLTCIFHNMGVWNAGQYGIRNAGACENWTFPLYIAINSKKALTNPMIKTSLEEMSRRAAEWITRWPWKKGQTPLALVPDYEKGFLDRVTHANCDDYPWMEPGYNSEAHFDNFADVPSFFSGSWYDHYARACTEGFYSYFSKIKKSPCRLLVGPWLHGEDLQTTVSGDVDFGPEVSVDLNVLRLKWFDHWLKGVKTDILDEKPIRYYRMGGGKGRKNKDGHMVNEGKWMYAEVWPLARTIFTKYYLHGDGVLNTDPPTEVSSSNTYQFDPDNPVPTIGGSNSTGILRNGKLTTCMGAQNQIEREGVLGCKAPYLPLWTRRDVLVFSTHPLQKELEVTGPITIKLWASSSCLDTDFTNRLIDIFPPTEDYPQGYHMNLTAGGGVIRARYRYSLKRAELLKPGEIYEFTITPKPTSNLFSIGHRIGLYLSSSSYPEFDVNPNTGEPLGQHRMRKVAENTIYHDLKHPSYIILPIIPKE